MNANLGFEGTKRKTESGSDIQAMKIRKPRSILGAQQD
jgi:hypothetical protein